MGISGDSSAMNSLLQGLVRLPLGTTDDYDYAFKLLVVGDTGIGKSSLVRDFIDGSYTENYVAPIGGDPKTRTTELEGEKLKLQLLDSTDRSYIKEADGVIVAYDITNKNSFTNVRQWLQKIDRSASEGICKMLVGTKSDLATNMRAVEKDTAKKLADELSIPFFETSAKQDLDVERAFLALAKQIKDKDHGMWLTKGFPSFVSYCIDNTEALVVPGKTFDEAIIVAKEAFPLRLANVTNNRISFSITIFGIKTKVTPFLWPVIFCQGRFPVEGLVYLDIAPERAGPPLAGQIASAGEDIDFLRVIILAYNQKQVFVSPGYTNNENIELTKATFPELANIPNNRISFSLRLSATKNQRILPSAWGPVMERYAIRKPKDKAYHVVYVSVDADKQSSTASAGLSGYVVY